MGAQRRGGKHRGRDRKPQKRQTEPKDGENESQGRFGWGREKNPTGGAARPQEIRKERNWRNLKGSGPGEKKSRIKELAPTPPAKKKKHREGGGSILKRIQGGGARRL